MAPQLSQRSLPVSYTAPPLRLLPVALNRLVGTSPFESSTQAPPVQRAVPLVDPPEPPANLDPDVKWISSRLYEDAQECVKDLNDRYLKDGRKKYSDEAHNEKQQNILDDLKKNVDMARERGQKVKTSAEKTLTKLKSKNPLDDLTAEDLRRAASLKPFIDEDAKRLSITRVTERLHALLANDDEPDKVQMALWSRSAAFRLEEERSNSSRGPRTDLFSDNPAGTPANAMTDDQARDLAALEAAISQLQDRLTDPYTQAERKTAVYEIESADALESYAQSLWSVLSGERDAAQRANAAAIRAEF